MSGLCDEETVADTVPVDRFVMRWTCRFCSTEVDFPAGTCSGCEGKYKLSSQTKGHRVKFWWLDGWLTGRLAGKYVPMAGFEATLDKGQDHHRTFEFSHSVVDA